MQDARVCILPESPRIALSFAMPFLHLIERSRTNFIQGLTLALTALTAQCVTELLNSCQLLTAGEFILRIN